MAVKSGFFNALNKDRYYDARSISQIFEGVLAEGIVSTIGDKFICKPIDTTKISIGTGFGYFKGYYLYNPEEYVYEIPESIYPDIPIYLVKTEPQLDYPSGNYLDLGDILVERVTNYNKKTRIEVAKDPQSDFPAGNPLDIGDIKVVKTDSYVEIIGIELEEEPQLDYPAGNYFDLGDISVGAITTDEVPLVIELNERLRTFEIKAVRLPDYNPEKQIKIAKIHRSDDNLIIENVIGYTGGPAIVTGLLQKTYWTELQDKINNDMSIFIPYWLNKRTDDFNNFITENEYYLHHHDESPSQYQRLLTEVNGKESKHQSYYDILEAGTTSKTFDLSIPADSYVEVKSSPYNLTITDIQVTNSTVTLHYNRIETNYYIYIIYRGA